MQRLQLSAAFPDSLISGLIANILLGVYVMFPPRFESYIFMWERCRSLLQMLMSVVVITFIEKHHQI